MSWAREFHDAGYDVTVVKGDGQEADSCAYFYEELNRDIAELEVHNPIMPPAPINIKSSSAAMDSRQAGFLLRLILRLKDNIKKYVPILDSYGLWERKALQVINRVVRENGPFDIIISTSFPLSAHKIAMKVKQKYGGIWSADFRDFYGQFGSNSVQYNDPRGRYLTKFLRLIGEQANLITTVSSSLELILCDIIRPKRILQITNGFFAEHMPTIKQDKLVYRILYSGSFNSAEFTVQPLAKALGLRKVGGMKNPDVVFTGVPVPAVISEFEKEGISCDFIGSRPNREVLRLQAESTFLLLCDAMSGNGALLTKTFEYMAAKRPMIVITKDGSDLKRSVFKQTAPGYCITDDASVIASFLERWDGLEPKATDFYQDSIINSYSREYQAVKLRKVIEELV